MWCGIKIALESRSSWLDAELEDLQRCVLHRLNSCQNHDMAWLCEKDLGRKTAGQLDGLWKYEKVDNMGDTCLTEWNPYLRLLNQIDLCRIQDRTQIEHE